MALPKLKKVPERSAGRVAAAPALPSAPSFSPEHSQQRAFWRAEIESLSNQIFSTFDDAISAIADKVLDRLGGNPEHRLEEKKFLIDLLVTDAQLCADVRSILKIS